MTARSKIIWTFSGLAVAGFAAWIWWYVSPSGKAKRAIQLEEEASSPAELETGTAGPESDNEGTAARPSKTVEKSLASLPAAAAYKPKNGIVEVEISEYAGYAGLITANGGLEPNENSEFFKRAGFKVRLKRSEVEDRADLNAGKLAALATTVDVLPIYGRQFQVVVPVQISYSRGADEVLVEQSIRKVNDLKGRVLALGQFSESEYLVRFLAQAAGLGVHGLAKLSDPPDPERVNLLYTEDAFGAGDLYLKVARERAAPLSGCVTWAPKTTEVETQLGGQMHVLVTCRNLLLIADILVVNKGFAQEHPKYVDALVAGLLAGNRKVQENPACCFDAVGRAYGWDPQKTRAELAKIHLSNLPENLAFFSCMLDAGGCFGDIYKDAVHAYGPDRIGNPVGGDYFVDLRALKAADRSGEFKGQQIAILPVYSPGSETNSDALLTRHIRFVFDPNRFTLRSDLAVNQRNLAFIKELLQISPGSTVLLRGHVDNSRIEEFRGEGGDDFVRLMAKRALELSLDRALEIRRLLVEEFDADPARIRAVGLGWNEPLGKDPNLNRQVEVQWFTIR